MRGVPFHVAAVSHVRPLCLPGFLGKKQWSVLESFLEEVSSKVGKKLEQSWDGKCQG